MSPIFRLFLNGTLLAGSPVEQTTVEERHEETPRQRVEFRVVCIDANGTELIWKYTKDLENALHYLNSLDPKFQAGRKCLIYEVQITETTRTVYTLDPKNAGQKENFG